MADREPDEALMSKISFEEVHRRREAGLCTFCDEQETPNHHLKHKRLRIFITNGDDHGDLWVMDDGDSMGDVDVTSAESMVFEPVPEEELSPEETKPIADSTFAIDCVHQETSIMQYEVPDSTLKPGHRFCSRSLVVCEERPYADAILRNDRVQFQSGFEWVKGKASAHQMFDKIFLRKFRLQQRRRKLSLSPKSWKFKYKEIKLLVQREMLIHATDQLVIMDRAYNVLDLRLIGVSASTKRKRWTKSWKFKFKNMKNISKLRGLKQEDEHKQREVMELIFSWDNRVWEPGGIVNAHDTWNMTIYFSVWHCWKMKFKLCLSRLINLLQRDKALSSLFETHYKQAATVDKSLRYYMELIRDCVKMGGFSPLIHASCDDEGQQYRADKKQFSAANMEKTRFERTLKNVCALNMSCVLHWLFNNGVEQRCFEMCQWFLWVQLQQHSSLDFSEVLMKMDDIGNITLYY